MTIAQFRTRFPQYADVVAYPDASLDPEIQEAVALINRDAFPTADVADRATYLLAAHYVATSVRRVVAGGTLGGSGREVQSVSAGGVSVTYASSSDGASGSRGDLASTPFGERYLQLARAYRGRMVVQ